MNVIESACSCGEPISIEIDSKISCRVDGKRPFYKDKHAEYTQLRCRKCSGWLANTCEAAAHGKEKANIANGRDRSTGGWIGQP